jgi:hypothetical protein
MSLLSSYISDTLPPSEFNSQGLLLDSSGSLRVSSQIPLVSNSCLLSAFDEYMFGEMSETYPRLVPLHPKFSGTPTCFPGKHPEFPETHACLSGTQPEFPEIHDGLSGKYPKFPQTHACLSGKYPKFTETHACFPEKYPCVFSKTLKKHEKSLKNEHFTIQSNI